MLFRPKDRIFRLSKRKQKAIRLDFVWRGAGVGIGSLKPPYALKPLRLAIFSIQFVERDRCLCRGKKRLVNG